LIENVKQDIKETVRRAYDFRCGYCDVREEEAGSELEVDHFQPRSAGGGDDQQNLVYCCTTCNRFKGDYWPASDAFPLLFHPQRDDLSEHLREEDDGRITPLSERGAFHLERLRLNRPPLVALRRARQNNARLLSELTFLRSEQDEMRKQLAARDEEIKQILDQLSRLLGE
jgi:uncharacterized protein (TIGR02646 family)